jgi:hypothetical protein
MELYGVDFSSETLERMNEAHTAAVLAILGNMPELDPEHRKVAERLVLARMIVARAIYHGNDATERQGWAEGVAASVRRYLNQPMGPVDWSGGFGRP